MRLCALVSTTRGVGMVLATFGQCQKEECFLQEGYPKRHHLVFQQYPNTSVWFFLAEIGSCSNSRVLKLVLMSCLVLHPFQCHQFWYKMARDIFLTKHIVPKFCGSLEEDQGDQCRSPGFRFWIRFGFLGPFYILWHISFGSILFLVTFQFRWLFSFDDIAVLVIFQFWWHFRLMTFQFW